MFSLRSFKTNKNKWVMALWKIINIEERFKNYVQKNFSLLRFVLRLSIDLLI